MHACTFLRRNGRSNELENKLEVPYLYQRNSIKNMSIKSVMFGKFCMYVLCALPFFISLFSPHVLLMYFQYPLHTP